MSCGRHNCNWMTCTLCRSGRQSISTLERASRRSVDWPVPVKQPPSDKDGSTNITIDDAFDDLIQYMSTTTKQCKRFHKSTSRKHTSDSDIMHLNRYHHNHQTGTTYNKNPLQKPEEINVEVAPGTYAVSAGSWGSDRQHTHVVHVKDGQMVDLNFGM